MQIIMGRNNGNFDLFLQRFQLKFNSEIFREINYINKSLLNVCDVCHGIYVIGHNQF